MNKKIINLDKHEDFIGLENVKDLYSILDYKPILIRTEFENNYLEYRSEGSFSLTFTEYLNLIKPYLADLINEKKNKGEWKLQLTAKISFVSLKPDSDETRLMHTRSNNEETMNGSETEEIIESLYRSLLQNYNDNLQEKMKGSDFVFNGINYFYYDFNRANICKGGSYIDSPKWLKDKPSTVNQKNNDFKCFQYATTLALNFDKVTNHPERVVKVKSFIDKYNWNDINFPANKKDWNRFEVNNKNVALNILYVLFKTKKIEMAYKSKYNLVRDNQVILLMISNGKNWHYLAVKSLSRVLRGIASNHDGDYYCLNCVHSYRTENKLNVHKKVCENRNYCKIQMPSNDNNFIKYNPDLSSTTKISQHVPSGYSIFTNCTFDKSYNKLIYYRGEDCMKRFCKDLRDHATRTIDFKKKFIIPLTKDEEDSYNNERKCHICMKDLDIDKVKDYCYFTGKYRGAAHSKCNLKHKIPKNITIIFHNGSKYDYHFIIRELASEFEGNVECLGENTEKYVTFSVPIKKRIENKNMDVTYKIKFVDSFRFMSTSLSKLVDNLTEGIHNDKCNKCESNLCFVNAMNETLTFECVDCKKEYKKDINNKLKERFRMCMNFVVMT